MAHSFIGRGRRDPATELRVTATIFKPSFGMASQRRDFELVVFGCQASAVESVRHVADNLLRTQKLHDLRDHEHFPVDSLYARDYILGMVWNHSRE